MTTVRKAVFALALSFSILLHATSPALAENERASGYFTVVDADTGQVVCRTGLVVYPQDQYLTGNNLLYRITRLDGLTAYADFVGRVEVHAETPVVREGIVHSLAVLLGLARTKRSQMGPVAVYHTHSDESYVPTEGTYSRPGRGGVYQVGRALAESLRRCGTWTVHSYASHDPHDGLAYERSRRTAADLLRRKPVALFDVHRDAAPRQEYADRVDNQGVTKVQIVLGRSNPNLKANEAFAQRVKAIVDGKYPGLIKGIWYGQGRYNQDLSPRALLLEFGAQTNSRQSAERGAAIFAVAAARVVASGPSGGLFGETGGAWRSILYVLGSVAVAAILFLLINAGSFRGAGRDLGRFIKREFASALGERKRRRKPPDSGRGQGGQ